MSIILKAENISKQYRLGTVGTGTLGDDLKRWWYTIRGKEDPFIKVGAVNDRGAKASENYVWALKNIFFEINQGEVLGIIGRNGAGKSTLLKLLSRVTAPTTGSIKTRGRIASLLEIGTGFHPELTGRENIFMNGAVLGMTRAEIKLKLDEIIAFSGCEMYIDTPVKRYSSGMKVRLGFAVAAHLEPDILVVDEVLAVGDAEFQKKAIGKMNSLSKGEGRTVLFVSHNMASIQNLCSRVLVLDNGKLVFNDKVEDAINFYLGSKKDIKLNYKVKPKTKGIYEVSFYNNRNEPINTVIVGQEVRIKVKFTSTSNRSVSLAMAFYDSYENFLFACRSDVINKTFTSEDGEVFLVIKKWPLSKGVYTYNTALHESGVKIENLLDVGRLTVEEGDFYGFGKLPAPTKRGFYIDYNWMKNV